MRRGCYDPHERINLADDPAPGVREQARRALGIHPGPEGKSSTAPLGACGESR